jgi:uncharacterized protein
MAAICLSRRTEAQIEKAAEDLRAFDCEVTALNVDLAKTDGVDKLLVAAKSHPIDYLLANAGRGLGRAFVEQDLSDM